MYASIVEIDTGGISRNPNIWWVEGSFRHGNPVAPRFRRDRSQRRSFDLTLHSLNGRRTGPRSGDAVNDPVGWAVPTSWPVHMESTRSEDANRCGPRWEDPDGSDPESDAFAGSLCPRGRRCGERPRNVLSLSVLCSALPSPAFASFHVGPFGDAGRCFRIYIYIYVITRKTTCRGSMRV